MIEPGESRVLADIQGPAQITHIWMTQEKGLRECLVKITYDNADYPSVLVPLGDFFGLGHGISNSYQSLLFSASAAENNMFNSGCALNSHVLMPFRERAVVELINESSEVHKQYFYVDYETLGEMPEDRLYFHSEFRRTNPFGGWQDEKTEFVSVANTEKAAWDNNYVILETQGRGHYIGCNLSVSNFNGCWWGEGDDMIWVDGYKWPPDLHGTGSEDYLGQAWCMQDNAFLRNGSSIFENNTSGSNRKGVYGQDKGGYQTSYVHHIENPVRFQKEIKVTLEHGHGNNLRNEMSSTAYWYADEPSRIVDPPPVEQRMPVLMDNQGNWLFDGENQCPGRPVTLSDEMKQAREK